MKCGGYVASLNDEYQVEAAVGGNACDVIMQYHHFKARVSGHERLVHYYFELIVLTDCETVENV
jgi:hypothetical protein